MKKSCAVKHESICELKHWHLKQGSWMQQFLNEFHKVFLYQLSMLLFSSVPSWSLFYPKTGHRAIRDIVSLLLDKFLDQVLDQVERAR